MRPIHVVGGGLAGSEAAWQAAEAGVPVVLHEMRPTRTTAAHRTAQLAELVCSNSFRSDDSSTNAVGVLHREMRALRSIVITSADAHQVPAGGALAVDRDGFSKAVEAAVLSHPLITLERAEIAGFRPRIGINVIVATGPLTSPALAQAIGGLTVRARSPSSTPSRRSCTAIPSTWTSPGCSRATTRSGPAATPRPTSTAR